MTSPSLTCTAEMISSWTGGYNGKFVIVNHTNFSISNWNMTITLSEKFSWISDVDVINIDANTKKLTPKSWLAPIPANGTYELLFGGISKLPTNIIISSNGSSGGDSGNTNPPVIPPRNVLSSKFVSPYTDTGLWPTPDFLSLSTVTNNKYFTAAFIVAGGNPPEACFAGQISYAVSKKFLQSNILAAQAQGCIITISMGGEAGQELANVITDEIILQKMYQNIIDTYNTNYLDFDIEGGNLNNVVANNRRNKVIYKLQQNNLSLRISYCLPVLPSGLTLDGINLIKNAKTNNVQIEYIGIMCMDYGDSAAPNPKGNMDKFAISAIENTYSQVVNVGYPNIKITPIVMIGQNDSPNEVFDLTDAKELTDYCIANSNKVRGISYWSLSRDRGSRILTSSSSTESGIVQQPYDFLNIFKGFTQ